MEREAGSWLRSLKEQGYFEKAEKILDEIIKDGEEAGKCR